MTPSETTGPRALLACDHFIRYETGLAQGLRANGWEPILLGRDHDHAFGGDPGAMRGYVNQRLGAQTRSLSVEGRVRDLGKWRSVPALRREMRDIGPHVTHIQDCVSHDPRLLLAARLLPRRYAITVHDVQVHPGDATPPRLQHQLFLALVRGAGLVFVHADSLRDQLLDLKLTRAPVVVVPHGVEDIEPPPLPQVSSLLFFGRLRQYKGLAVLLDALPRVWQHRPETTLTIGGEGDVPQHPVLADARVRLLHRHLPEAEVPGLFAGASLVVLPYLEASQSGVGSLAKSYGRPLVATAVGGLPELLSDGSGVLVPPGQAGALADAIIDLLDSPARLARLRSAGLRTVQERSGWPVVGGLTVEAYARHLGVPLPRATGARAIA